MSKGGRGVGSQMGSTLPLHTGYVLRYVIIRLRKRGAWMSLLLKHTWTGKPEVIDPALVVASDTGWEWALGA